MLEIDEMFGDFDPVPESQGTKEEAISMVPAESDNTVLLADLLTDALPDDNLLPSQLLAQLDFSSNMPLSTHKQKSK